jgi:hypothetical protein
MSSDYWDPCTSVQHNSTTSSISPVTFPVTMQRQETHMIATPGFSNQHTLHANPEHLNVPGYLAQVQQKQQNPLSVNQNTYPLQQPVNHVDFGVHSRMQVKSSLYDLSDPQIDDGMGLHGSNMLLTNRDAASEAFINLSPYCSYPEKTLKPELHLPSMHAIFIFYIYSLSFIPLCLIIFPCKNIFGTTLFVSMLWLFSWSMHHPTKANTIPKRKDNISCKRAFSSMVKDSE